MVKAGSGSVSSQEQDPYPESHPNQNSEAVGAQRGGVEAQNGAVGF